MVTSSHRLTAEERPLPNMMEFTASRSPDADFWFQKLHGHFYKLLVAGDYAPTERQRYVDWFSIWTNFLGPRPMVVDGRDTPVVKSFMCDDHAPIEFSHMPLLLPRNPTIMDSVLFIHILEVFGFTRLDGQWKASTSVANILLAYDLLPDYIETKAHAVFRPTLNRTEKLTLLSEAMSGSGREKPWSIVINYLQSKPSDWQTRFSPDPIFVAVHCKDSDDARVKVYFRYQFTDIDCLVDHSPSAEPSHCPRNTSHRYAKSCFN
ncbi:hypothetical protein JB92DRAFT_3218978 [Gautieria morchelliformis]|nr:hypothetical protein JB92DRAFT_3218978 [Gautieria morchelliformis]